MVILTCGFCGELGTGGRPQYTQHTFVTTPTMECKLCSNTEAEDKWQIAWTQRRNKCEQETKVDFSHMTRVEGEIDKNTGMFSLLLVLLHRIPFLVQGKQHVYVKYKPRGGVQTVTVIELLQQSSANTQSLMPTYLHVLKLWSWDYDTCSCNSNSISRYYSRKK